MNQLRGNPDRDGIGMGLEKQIPPVPPSQRGGRRGSFAVLRGSYVIRQKAPVLGKNVAPGG